MNKPNVLLIMTDQQSKWTISALGAKDIQTPNMDRIGQEGAIFENFYTPCAVCTPSRACFLTGLHSPENGAMNNQQTMKPEIPTIAEIFRDIGYDTGYAGKWHLNGEAKPGWMTVEESRGFTDCRYMFNRGHWKCLIEDNETHQVDVTQYSDTDSKDQSQNIGNEETYTTDFLTNKTVDFIKNRNKDKPFLYMLNIPDPHTPFTVRAPYDTMFDPEKINLPDAFYVDCPEWSIGMDENGDKKRSKAKQLLSQYYGEVKCIDDNLGKIFDTLEKENILDDTVIVFTTDHGEYMGEHGLWHKNSTFPSVYHIPFFMRYPKKIRTGTKIENFVSSVDFKKMIMSIAEIKNDDVKGKDASILFNGYDKNWDNTAHMYNSSYISVMLQKDNYFLGVRKDGYRHFYDTKKDPLLLDNLYSNSSYFKYIDAMYEEIYNLHSKINSPAMKWLPKKL